MKNTPKTLKGFKARAKAALKATPGKTLHISKGNNKIGSTDNVSLLPLFTCGNCKECSKYCYAVRICNYSPDALRAYAENTKLYQEDPDSYFNQVRAHLSSKAGGFFRWHVSGEIPSPGYFREIVKIAEQFPNWKFWMYTKRYDIVNHWPVLPDNLVVMYSKWAGVDCPNPHGRPEFRTRLNGMTEDQFKGLWKCPGDKAGGCQACIAMGRGCPFGETTYNDEH